MLEDIEELLSKLPFEPFRIVISSGDKYAVSNPHNVAIGKSKLSYFFPRSDHWVFIRLNQITAIESLKSASKS